MSEMKNETPANDGSHTVGGRRRPCLTCQEPFESSWIGERICRQCKCKNTWKNGVPLEASRQRNHRRGSSSSS